MNRSTAFSLLYAVVSLGNVAVAAEVNTTAAGYGLGASAYDAEALVFERKAARYAMAAKQSRAAGKMFTAWNAKRYDELSQLYVQRAEVDRSRAALIRKSS